MLLIWSSWALFSWKRTSTSTYYSADQRIFPYNLMFVDLEQLVPVQLEEDLYILLLITEHFLIT